MSERKVNELTVETKPISAFWEDYKRGLPGRLPKIQETTKMPARNRNYDEENITTDVRDGEEVDRRRLTGGGTWRRGHRRSYCSHSVTYARGCFDHSGPSCVVFEEMHVIWRPMTYWVLRVQHVALSWSGPYSVVLVDVIVRP